MVRFCRIILSVFLFVISFTSITVAQKPLVTESKKQELQVLSGQLDQTFKAAHQTALGIARRNGWPLNRIQRNGSVIRLQRINELGFPVYLKTDNNTIAAATTNTNAVQPGGVSGLNLSGSGVILNNRLAMWDGGEILSTHQEFAGKNIVQHDDTYGIIQHATHVAGTLEAKGINAPAKGMAFGANTLITYDFDNDEAEMTAAAAGGLLLSNHSYGSLAGWSFNEPQNRWEWYGLPGSTEDYVFGYYDSRAQAWDNIAYNAPYYLIVEAAGNSHDETGPPVGDDYYGYRSITDPTLVDKGPRPAGISSNDGYDVITSSANAKNILTVGAVNPLPYGPVNSSDVAVAYFSSWGPTDDGRIKPDICGMGVNVLSTSNTGNTDYATLSGTSMSTPNVTGSLYLLQEYYAQQNANNFMRSATLKALACHTAFDAGNPGPDYIYGWGLLDTRKAAQVITDNGVKSLINENILQQGQTQAFQVIASGNGVLSATIAWTDPQGTPAAVGTLNSRTPKLVNDLDIQISDGTNTYYPWVLDPANPSLPAITGNNIRDNIEQVYIANTKPGQSYTITVSHKGTLQSGAQPYSLIATGIGGSAYCASAPLSSADSRIDNFTLSNLDNTPAAGCTSYSDYTNLTAQLEQGKTYPLSITLGTCGNNFNKAAKVYIDYNADGVFDPVSELVATTAVMNDTGAYNTNIVIPANVIADNYSLMRVVLTETSDTASIAPCGNYAKGETQDYKVQFIKAGTDAGVINIANSNPRGTCAGTNNITVTLKNFGRDTITNIPVMVTITNPDNSIITFNETDGTTLAPGAQDDFMLTGTFNTVAGATYHIDAASNLTGDPITGNNELSVNIATSMPPSSPDDLLAYYCDDTHAYLLNGKGDGNIFWYKSQDDAVPVAAGATVSTAQAPADSSTFYAGVNDLNTNVGPVNKAAFAGGSYDQFTNTVNITTAVPLIIQSARLYIGNSGLITFNVINTDGEVVSATTINARATRTAPARGAQADDPNDAGHVYSLNLLLPAAGNYTISVSYRDAATLYRSNAGVNGYPFGIPGIFTITGNSAIPGSQGLYFYFYNMHIQSAGCAAPQRQAVTLTKPVISYVNGLLSSNMSVGNQWYYNDQSIKAATGQSYVPTLSGTYKVGFTVSTGCMVFSDEYHYALTALHPDNSDIGLAVFPVPANNQLNVVFHTKANEHLVMSLINTAGQVVYVQEQNISAGNFSAILDVSRQIAGTYILRIMAGSKVYSRKVIIGH
jgi:hypothetical protein